ncbi:hypothetical protein E4U41_001826, partial [Claviceps citrina]
MRVEEDSSGRDACKAVDVVAGEDDAVASQDLGRREQGEMPADEYDVETVERVY